VGVGYRVESLEGFRDSIGLRVRIDMRLLYCRRDNEVFCIQGDFKVTAFAHECVEV
jgi:hypothetical protein